MIINILLEYKEKETARSVIYTIDDAIKKIEEMDEMAYEHLNEASRIVLLEQGLIGAVLLIVDVLLDLSKVVLSKELTIGNFMMLNPASCMMILIGFQYFMTGFHFRRLERE